MAVKPIYLAEAVVGGLMVYAAIKNYTISSVLQNLLKGQINGTPAGNNLTALGYSPSSGSTTPSSSPGGTTPAVSGNFNSIGLSLSKDYHYSAAAAAGICACIDGESGGDPESVGTGGCGLIGWTPPSSLAMYGGTCKAAGIGNASEADDLSSQIAAIDKYNAQNGNVSALNAQTNPVDAADYYSQNFERPAVTDSDVRASVANSVYQYLKGQGIS